MRGAVQAWPALGGNQTFSGLTMTGNLIFVADATYDIGASGATRPRDFFLSRNAVVGGTLTVSGTTGTLNMPSVTAGGTGLTMSGWNVLRYTSSGDALDIAGYTAAQWATVNIYAAAVKALAITSTTAVLAGSIATADPTGGAGAWKLGIANAVSPTSPNRTLTVDIGGTLYYIHAKTTNN